MSGLQLGAETRPSLRLGRCEKGSSGLARRLAAMADGRRLLTARRPDGLTRASAAGHSAGRPLASVASRRGARRAEAEVFCAADRPPLMQFAHFKPLLEPRLPAAGASEILLLLLAASSARKLGSSGENQATVATNGAPRAGLACKLDVSRAPIVIRWRRRRWRPPSWRATHRRRATGAPSAPRPPVTVNQLESLSVSVALVHREASPVRASPVPTLHR